MNEEIKLIKHHLQSINLLTFEERKVLVKKYLKENSYRQISKETSIPLSTLHGYASERNLYRSEKTIRDIGTLNEKLIAVLKILRTIKSLDNNIAVNYMKTIKREIRRIEKDD